MKTLRVGLTGGIGAGKSEVLRAFRAMGAGTLSLDEVSRLPAVARAAAKALGTADRARLADMVFSDPRARRTLERATHPIILREMRRWLKSRRGVAVVEAPLLFEAGIESDFDVTVSVSSRRRRGEPRRAAAQWPPRAKDARADVVIRNDGTLADLRRAVKQHQDAFVLIAAPQGGRNG